MNKKLLLSTILLGMAGVGYADAPSGYYNSLEGLTGPDLKNAVKSVARQNFRQVPYGTKSTLCTWEVFLESDTRWEGTTRYWWDMYSANKIAAPDRYTRGDMNIEHAVPNSWWGGDSSIDAYVDLFHLNPSDATANNHKQNYPLGVVESLSDADTWYNDGHFTTVGKPALASCGGATYVFEPADEYKGDFARAFFYIFTAYDDIAWRQSGTNWMYDTKSPLSLKPWAYDMLLEWAENDPVSQKEIDRNNTIALYQGNRNPFIDCPDLAKYIWGEYRDTPYHKGSNQQPVIKTKGYWTAVSSSADLNEDYEYIAVSASNHVALSIYEPTYDIPYYMMECYKAPVFDAANSKNIVSAPDDVAILKLQKDGSNWKIAVTDIHGGYRGVITSAEAKKMNLTSSPDSYATVRITPAASKTDVYFTASQSYLKYNNYDTGRRFTTYASGLENIILYKFVPAEDDDNGDDNNEDNGNGDNEEEDQVVEFEITEDFTVLDAAFPIGASAKPNTAKEYTSTSTGITYSIMGCYINNNYTPAYLFINGKYNEGAYISFTLKNICKAIKMTTTESCSTNSTSAVNVYADDQLIGKYSVNGQNTTYTIDIPEDYRHSGTIYKIESATTAYNQQFLNFTYICDRLTGIEDIDDATEEESLTVYNLQGVRINVADRSDLSRLPAGIYIINGKKVLTTP